MAGSGSRYAWLLLGLLLLGGMLRVPRASAAGPGEGTIAGAEKSVARPLAEMLAGDGTLELPSGFAGALDPAGWRLASGQSGEPRFLPAGTPGDEAYDDRFGLPGVGCCTVYTFASSGTDLYVGGYFSEVGGVPAYGIARWDGRRWHALGEGLRTQYGGTPNVRAIAVQGDTVYAAGDFDLAGTSAATNIARWDGTQWHAMGSGSDDVVRALALGGDGALYAGGEFVRMDGQEVNGIARWNGAGWSALGAGLGYSYGGGGDAYALAVRGNDLYVGGSFELAGGVSSASIARWDGTQWHGLGTGLTTQYGRGTGYSMVTDGADLYVGGDFTSAGGTAANRVARWDGAEWHALGAGIGAGSYSAPAHALALYDGKLYAGGDFDTAGGVMASNLASWDGTTWQAVMDGTTNGTSSTVFALATAADSVWVGGDFDRAGTHNARRVARWDGAWHALGEGPNGGSCCGYLSAVAIGPGGELYVGGYIQYVGGLPVNNIAMWDGARWHAMGAGTDGTVLAIAVAGDDVYVGGNFTAAGGRSAAHIARWNRQTQQWYPLGSGVNALVAAIAIEGESVYVGGDFTAAGTAGAQRIARWQGGAWSSLGADLEIDWRRVNAIATAGRYVFIGGSFTTVAYQGTDVTVNGLIFWDSVDDVWYTMNGGVKTSAGGGATVNALAIIADTVYVGGDFVTAGMVSAPGIAAWNFATNAWSSLGSGLGGGYSYDSNALAAQGDTLYVGGDFETAGGLTANHLARWQHGAQQWEPLGSGVAPVDNAEVNSVAVAGGDLWAGGSWVTAGGIASHNVAHLVIGVPAAQGAVTPQGGGTVAAPDNSVRVEFPAGAVPEPVTVAFTPLDGPPHPAPAGDRALRGWDFTARDEAGQIVARFARPYTMRVRYDGTTLAAAGVNAQSLRVAYWNGTRWVALPSTVDEAASEVVATADHFTEFALLGSVAPPTPTSHSVYLPLMTR